MANTALGTVIDREMQSPDGQRYANMIVQAPVSAMKDLLHKAEITCRKKSEEEAERCSGVGGISQAYIDLSTDAEIFGSARILAQ